MNEEQQEDMGSEDLCTFPMGRVDEACVTAPV